MEPMKKVVGFYTYMESNEHDLMIDLILGRLLVRQQLETRMTARFLALRWCHYQGKGAGEGRESIWIVEGSAGWEGC